MKGWIWNNSWISLDGFRLSSLHIRIQTWWPSAEWFFRLFWRLLENFGEFLEELDGMERSWSGLTDLYKLSCPKTSAKSYIRISSEDPSNGVWKWIIWGDRFFFAVFGGEEKIIVKLSGGFNGKDGREIIFWGWILNWWMKDYVISLKGWGKKRILLW